MISAEFQVFSGSGSLRRYFRQEGVVEEVARLQVGDENLELRDYGVADGSETRNVASY